MTGRLIIALDGPSGSGKSSVSKAVARALGIGYLDTGAMYRALAWWCLSEGIDLDDREAVSVAAQEFPLVMGTNPEAPTVHVGESDVSFEIRTDRVTSAVTAVATNPLVRPILQGLQRRLMEQIAHETGGVLAEGRDITTVVAPDADVRLLLTASEEARLRRRSTELHGSDDQAAVAATHAQIVGRDRADSTVSQFTVAADGVTTLDTSDLDFDQSVAAVLALVTQTGTKDGA